MNGLTPKSRIAWVISATLIALVGCQSAPRQNPKPVAEAPPPPPPPASPATPRGVTFFGDEPDVEQVPFETRLVTNLSRHSFTTEGLDFDPDIRVQENLLVYASTRNSVHPDVFMKDVDGATLVQLTSDPADDIQPRFSPDGQQVAFCSNRGGNWDIWVINRDGSGLMQLTHDHADEISPCWSPDGTQIAYTLWGHQSQQWEIWTLSAEQPGTRRFLAYGMFPSWSPGGERIAFQRARQRGSRLFSVWTIQLVDSEAKHPTEIAYSDHYACIAPRWSPDGSMLVYCAVPETRPESDSQGLPVVADLWIADLQTGVKMKLTDGGTAAFNPVWSESGRIFFVSPRSGTENIWSLTTTLGSYASGTEAGPRVSRANSALSDAMEKD